MSSTLNVEKNPQGILSLTLNRPERLNTLNAELLQALHTVLMNAKQDNSVRAILLTGAGEKAFCAGADIKQIAGLSAQQGFEFARQGQAVFSLLENLGKPSVAAINGYTFGGGCELVMSASLRIASNSAQFGQPEIKLGVIPGYGGTQRLARLIGKGRALDLCLTGRSISAQDALQWGLVSELTTPDALLPRAHALLDTLLAQAPVALRYILDAIHHGYDLTLEEALNLEASYFGLCCATQDKTEGVNAFLEKRKPSFSGM
ncbi:MAG: enoyl-CoA hydratase/isomerase family protein [Gammaproteobacteria bacterium]|nr:enoyl-CoA hydratase/isomerase family protein [Gammaproteobacteria bacterium]